MSNHAKHSGEELSFIPHIIETSAGADRSALAFLVESYREEEKRVYLNLAPVLTPYKVAVFPLLANKPALVEKAREVYSKLKTQNSLTVYWDDRGNIGKRYYSQDEIGTPHCITVDFQTLEDDTVTIRDRDIMKQERVRVGELINYLTDKFYDFSRNLQCSR